MADLRAQLAKVRASLNALADVERRGLPFDPATLRQENAEMDALRATLKAMREEELRLLGERDAGRRGRGSARLCRRHRCRGDGRGVSRLGVCSGRA